MAQFFCPEMASEALVPGDLIENFPGIGGGGGGNTPRSSLAGACLCNWVSCSTLKF